MPEESFFVKSMKKKRKADGRLQGLNAVLTEEVKHLKVATATMGTKYSSKKKKSKREKKKTPKSDKKEGKANKASELRECKAWLPRCQLKARFRPARHPRQGHPRTPHHAPRTSERARPFDPPWALTPTPAAVRRRTKLEEYILLHYSAPPALIPYTLRSL